MFSKTLFAFQVREFEGGEGKIPLRIRWTNEMEESRGHDW